MRRIAAMLLATVLAFVLTACRGREDPAEDDSQTPETQVQTERENPELSVSEEAETNILIAYFSLGRNAVYPDDVDAGTSASLVPDGDELVGTTEFIARLIQDHVGGDLHSIETVEPYSTDFDTVVDQNHEEMGDGILPELVATDRDVSAYDTVFIGYPVWATNAPQAIFSFLSQWDFSGKTIIPFCTHNGYGPGGSYGAIADAVDGQAAVVLDGLAVEASEVSGAADTVAEWLGAIGIKMRQDNSSGAEETAITIAIGDTVLDGVLYDTALAHEISEFFPLTVSMVGFGGREYYGGVDFYPKNLEGGRTTFENGHITYCEAHHNMAIFYAQTDDPVLSVEVIPIGRVMSDLSVFEDLSGHAEVTFSLAEE